MGLKLNGSSSGSVELNAPADTTSGADVVLTLPVNDGDANEFLQTDDLEIQVGDADAWITTGYFSNSANNSGSAAQGKTNSFFFNDQANGDAASGRMVFQRDADTGALVMNGSVTAGPNGAMKFATGHLVHTDLVVTRVRLTIASGNYDSGVINLYYHG